MTFIHRDINIKSILIVIPSSRLSTNTEALHYVKVYVDPSKNYIYKLSLKMENKYTKSKN